MPRHCSIFGCRSNYKGEPEMFTTFAIPKQEPLHSLWLRKIPTDFSGIKNPIVCIKHFDEASIIRTDVLIIKGERKEFPRKIPKLKDNSFPTIFPNVPTYLNKPCAPRRLIDAEEANYELAISESLRAAEAYKQKDIIHSIINISTHMSEHSTFKNWLYILNEDKIVLLFMNTQNVCPEVLGTVVITKTLDMSVYIKKRKIKNDKLPKSVTCINSFNILDDVLTFVEGECIVEPSTLDNIDIAVEILMQHTDYENSNHLKFLVEQLKLFKISKNGRRYNNNTMIFASTLYVHSPSAYNAMRKSDLLFLPHPRNLQKLIGTFNLNGMNLQGSINYLKGRLKYLTDFEKLVVVHLDEIYIQPELNFKGGNVYGVNIFNSCETAKTAQVFMISSILSKYKDVVCIAPVSNLQSEQLHSMALSVLTEIEAIGFTVIALISDNNAVNRKSFEFFSADKTLKPFVAHPLDQSRKLFLIFDTVHIIKCVRNNWECKKDTNRSIHFPSFNDNSVMLSANYKHLELLYQVEKKSLLKYSNLLSYKVIYPSNVQKQNVKLVLKLFAELNIVALQHISKDNPNLFGNVGGTVEFLSIFVRWWKTVNVKSVHESKRFNDPHREAIKSTNDSQIEFLAQFTSWLKNWKNSIPDKSGLTSQTFTSITHTCTAFLELIPYLFTKYKFNYILLSKFQNDNIENRFGSYRQLSGSNYYISYIQLLENERKIRFTNCVMLVTDHFNIHLKTMLPCDDSVSDEIDIGEYIEILNSEFFSDCIPKDILKILAYIGGYAVKKVLNRSNCELCISWLRLNKEIEIVTSDEYLFIENLSRGKLMLPTQYVIYAVSNVWFVMKCLTEKFHNQFMQNQGQLSILHKLCCILISREHSFPFKEECLCNLTLKNKLESITLIACKIFINNYIKSLNDEHLNKKKLQSDQRKIKKLRKF